MVELRPYQREAVDAIEREWHEGRDRTLLVLPTGTGKTVVFSSVIRDMVQSGRVLVLAHREELLTQAAGKIEEIAEVPCGFEKAERHNAGEPVVVASVQSIGREKRLESFTPDTFSAVIVDEAHHVLADSYKRIIDYFGHAYLLGVTATPDRGDRRSLARVFDSIAYEYKLADAINDGYLCRIIAKTAPLQIDASGLKVTAGDYSLESAGSVIDPYLEQIADVIAKEVPDRHTVIFLPLVNTAKRMCNLLRARGIVAEEVDGQSSDRAGVLKRFETGQTKVLCNAMLLTEGWDCPITDCIVVLRPTKVRSLYAQMVGRGTRPAPGKENLLLLDFLWMTGKLRLCRPSALVAKSDDEARRMDAIDGDILEVQGEVERDVLAEREAALAKELAVRRKSKNKLVDVVQYEMSIGSEALSSYEPSFAWERLAPTEAQVKMLEKFGISTVDITRGKASALIDVLTARCEGGMATPKQIRVLERNHFQHPGKWTFEEANAVIGQLAGVGWKPWRLPFDPKTYIPESLMVS